MHVWRFRKALSHFKTDVTPRYRMDTVKKYLWGGEFWTDGYFIATVGAHGNEQMIQKYVEQQGKVAGNGQLGLF